jgi:hypothetical protein
MNGMLDEAVVNSSIKNVEFRLLYTMASMDSFHEQPHINEGDLNEARLQLNISWNRAQEIAQILHDEGYIVWEEVDEGMGREVG